MASKRSSLPTPGVSSRSTCPPSCSRSTLGLDHHLGGVAHAGAHELGELGDAVEPVAPDPPHGLAAVGDAHRDRGQRVEGDRGQLGTAERVEQGGLAGLDLAVERDAYAAAFELARATRRLRRCGPWAAARRAAPAPGASRPGLRSGWSPARRRRAGPCRRSSGCCRRTCRLHPGRRKVSYGLPPGSSTGPRARVSAEELRLSN